MKSPSGGLSMKPSSPEMPPGRRPLWPEEFSVQTTEDKYVLRRQFTKFLVLTSLGMFVGNVWIWVRSLFGRSRVDPDRSVIADAAQLAPGDVKLFNYPTPADHCILVRKPDGELVAYSQKCTHLSCAVYYSRESNRLECPCHEGYFSIDNGRVIQGPPPRPLPRIRLEQLGNEVLAVGIEPAPEGA